MKTLTKLEKKEHLLRLSLGVLKQIADQRRGRLSRSLAISAVAFIESLDDYETRRKKP
jgi:hypothetical protein